MGPIASEEMEKLDELIEDMANEEVTFQFAQTDPDQDPKDTQLYREVDEIIHDFNKYDKKEAILGEAIQSSADIGKGVEDVELGYSSQILFTLQSVRLFAEKLVDEEETRFMVAMFISSIMINFIKENPDIETTTDVLSYIYLSFVALSYVLGDPPGEI